MLLSLIASGSVQFSDTGRYLSKPFENIRYIPSNGSLYGKTVQNCTCGEFMEVIKLGNNYFRLLSFSQLTKGWNGYDAEALSPVVLQNAKSILMKLDFQPKIFPTARGTIQIEFYKNDDNLFELEVFEDRCSLYSIEHGEETESDMTKEMACEKVNRLRLWKVTQ